MANTDLIAPIIVAVIGLLGSFVSVLLGWYNQHQAQKQADKAQIEADKLEQWKMDQARKQDEHKAELAKVLANFNAELARKEMVSTLTEKYVQSLIVAAYDLQQRLFELVEYPISRQHIEKPEGIKDLKIFTCYLLAQYLVATHIIRTQTGYLSFSTNDEIKKMRKIMYLIDEELDRRRDRTGDGNNVGVWPGARILICERMILNLKDVNNALDGGLGVDVKGFNRFSEDWNKEFKEPMGYFCEIIDDMLDGRMRKVNYSDAALRVLQHLLVDLVKRLDTKEAYVTYNSEDMKCKRSSRGCDCDGKNCKGGVDTQINLKARHESRWNDAGLWAREGLNQNRPKKHDHSLNKKIKLEEVRKMTHYIDLD
ncbi:hypothetical protein BKA63DRAFT_512839 [Paraphoma chrysanthemicola]|nr:hypothetical protein BKA63DRAFT_512839 [Paraphoma chrysanthemicola]